MHSEILCIFAVLPDLHNYCSESGTKAMKTVHADKQCYQWMESILSESPMCFILSWIECKVELRCHSATDCRADRSFSLGVTGLWDVKLWSVFCVKSHKTFCQWPGNLLECHAIAVYRQFICRNMEQEYCLVRVYSSACALHMYHYHWRGLVVNLKCVCLSQFNM